jgi:nitrate reductase beta subunit
MSKFAPHRRSNNNPRANSATVCQKCLGTGMCPPLDVVAKAIWTERNHAGHFIFECKSTRPYVSRPSRTEMLENPKLLAKLKAEGKPSVEVPEEFKTKYVDQRPYLYG